jgi:integrase
MASIYRRANGVYYVKFRQNGRWHYRSLKTKNRRQADKEKAELEKRLAAQAKTTAPQKNITFSALTKRYLDWAATQRRPDWLTKDQIETVIEKAELHGPNAHLFFAQCLYAGMRKDEAINARWEWYDFEAGLIHIQEGHGWKAKTGNRSLPLHSKLRAILLEYGPPATGTGYVIAPDKDWGKNRYRFDIRKTFAAVA